MPVDTVLVLTGDRAFGSELSDALQHLGHVVAVANKAARGLLVLDEIRPDAVIIDLSMVNGWEACGRVIASHPATSVVVITERDMIETARLRFADHRVRVVVKAESTNQLAHRVQRALQHTTDLRLQAGDIEIDRGVRQAWLGGDEIVLRVKEFDLLVALVANRGRAVTRDELMVDVWHEDGDDLSPSKTLDVHIAALRRKLGEPAGAPSRIATIRGVGYRLEAHPDPVG
jgi:DNA-binding response OmpR family regulator